MAASSISRIYGPIWIEPGRVGGDPCVTGTRFPVQNLFDYIGTGESLETFLEHFPSVAREHALEVVRMAGEKLILLGVLISRPVSR
jgi:uncharacterized protein (DUF433 family)